MEMRKCERGHYYDASTNAECPYCKNMTGTGATVGLTGFAAPSDDSKTMPLKAMADFGSEKTVALVQPPQTNPDDEGKTVALIKENKGIDPVVGWLVCIEGKERGKDYRIHSDNNFIGRSERMDICIKGDETVSRDNHAIVSYDAVDGIYYFSPGDGRAIVRHNDKATFQTVELKAYDKVTIGNTVLLFIPLCGKQFTW